MTLAIIAGLCIAILCVLFIAAAVVAEWADKQSEDLYQSMQDAPEQSDRLPDPTPNLNRLHPSARKAMGRP